MLDPFALARVRDQMCVEDWRPVVGLEGRYEVSNLGRVRSLTFASRWGRFARATPIYLRPHCGVTGYPAVAIGGRLRSVHRLVLEAFVGPCPAGMECAHLNGVRDDPRLSNLRWVTRRENASHRAIHGTVLTGDRHPSRLHPERLARGDKSGARLHPETRPRGEKHGLAKLTDEAVRAIRAAAATGESQYVLAARFGVTQGTIWNVVWRKTWRHIKDVA